MKPSTRRILIGLGALSVAALASPQSTPAKDPSPAPSASTLKPPPDLSGRVQEITDVVLEHHIDPPARQQMILSGLKALYQASGVPTPAGLGRRVSAVATPEQLAALIAECWPKPTAKAVTETKLEDAFVQGLVQSIPGGAWLISAKERKVEEQLEGNRYVGIHIALGMDDKEKRPVIMDVFEGGPADRAGVKKHDLLEEVDGRDTQGMSLHWVIDRTRGEEGTEVRIKVRQPREPKSRTMTITRGQLPHPTIAGIRKRSSGDWVVRFEGPDPIGYLRITEISASTPHELRKLAPQLETQGARALILDLRGHVQGKSVHPAVLLADCLLDRGPIGRLRTAQGQTSYQAEPDALFRGWPMAVLVGPNTSGTAEWLAAALQDNHRAMVIGTPTQGAQRGGPARGMILGFPTHIRSRVSIGDGSWSIELATGRLERADGRPMSLPTEAVSGELPRLARPLPDRETFDAGLTPDHLIPERPSHRAGSERPNAQPPADDAAPTALRSASTALESLRESVTDATLKKAVEVLRAALPKDGVAQFDRK